MVTASHKAHGLSAPVEARPGASPITIRMSRVGALHVRPRDVASEGGARSGALEYVLLDAAGKRVDDGHTWGAKLVLEEVREGYVDCWLRLGGSGFIGHAATELRAGSPEQLEVPMRRTWQFVGTVTEADGLPAARHLVRLETDA